jgi:Asp-tRNA(Asn)/Glu-tRNA(Gln) amidotransferase A subunit family amidase
MPAAIAGWPIATVPLGLVAGLPVGAALLGRPGSEWLLLEVAGWIEDVVAGAVGRPGFAAGGRG